MRGKLAVVIWKDACLYYSKTKEENLVETISVGWVVKKKDRIVVIQNISDGEEDTKLVIPKDWLVKIFYLQEVKK